MGRARSGCLVWGRKAHEQVYMGRGNLFAAGRLNVPSMDWVSIVLCQKCALGAEIGLRAVTGIRQA